MTQDAKPDVRVGDSWASLDRRDRLRYRWVEVENLEGDFVFVVSYFSGRLGRRSRIHRSRFDGIQFKLLSRAANNPTLCVSAEGAESDARTQT